MSSAAFFLALDLIWCLSVACSSCGCECSFFCEIIVEHEASVLIRALQRGMNFAHRHEISPVFRVASSLYLYPSQIILFWPRFFFYHRNIHLSCEIIFERLTKMTKIIVGLILLMTNKRSFCIGKHYLPVPLTCNPLISFSLSGPIEKSSNVHYDLFITKTRLFKYIEKFTTKKRKFSDKNSIFHISAQNIDCGYSLEPPRRGGSNEYPQSMFWAEIRKIMYTPVNPSFTI